MMNMMPKTTMMMKVSTWTSSRRQKQGQAAGVDIMTSKTARWETLPESQLAIGCQ